MSSFPLCVCSNKGIVFLCFDAKNERKGRKKGEKGERSG